MMILFESLYTIKEDKYQRIRMHPVLFKSWLYASSIKISKTITAIKKTLFYSRSWSNQIDFGKSAFVKNIALI